MFFNIFLGCQGFVTDVTFEEMFSFMHSCDVQIEMFLGFVGFVTYVANMAKILVDDHHMPFTSGILCKGFVTEPATEWLLSLMHNRDMFVYVALA